MQLGGLVLGSPRLVALRLRLVSNFPFTDISLVLKLKKRLSVTNMVTGCVRATKVAIFVV